MTSLTDRPFKAIATKRGSSIIRRYNAARSLVDRQWVSLAALGFLAGCAQLEFSDGWVSGGAHYYDPVPYVLVTVGKDCMADAKLIMLPGVPKTVSLKSGYGSANLSANFQNGMLASVGQQTDTKIPETITALTGAASAAAKIQTMRELPPTPPSCTPKAVLYRINNGVIDQQPLPLPTD